MVRGVATDAVSGILRRLPHRKRLSVKTVTTDLSSAMMLTVRKVFPAAKLINDRFHVQQLMSEAVDQLRIRYRWKVLDAENQAIREHLSLIHILIIIHHKYMENLSHIPLCKII